jgi:uncharacterized membrane protein YdjX (TVP38/TMEM64 family)
MMMPEIVFLLLSGAAFGFVVGWLIEQQLRK